MTVTENQLVSSKSEEKSEQKHARSPQVNDWCYQNSRYMINLALMQTDGKKKLKEQRKTEKRENAEAP